MKMTLETIGSWWICWNTLLSAMFVFWPVRRFLHLVSSSMSAALMTSLSLNLKTAFEDYGL